MGESPLNVVVAFIQPFQLEAVVDALRLVPGCPGMSASEVRGVGCTGAHPPRKGERIEVEPLERRVRIEIFCREADMRGIVEAIRATAHTGNHGDGKIFVGPVTLAQRIRTGESGEAAVRPGHGLC
jgi:nitrogen regulatory protein PII